MTRTTPNFHATPTEGRLTTMYDLAWNRPHTRQIFSGIVFRAWNPPAPKPRLTTRPPRPSQQDCWKLSANASFGIARSAVVTRCWICTMPEKRRPFRTPLRRGNNKFADVRSVKYGGCSRTVTLGVARKFLTRIAVCGRALS
ncbi:hypothetical protein AVEN_175604-1 [Araneus ventricosus]|uniref:Uncharacterized protein n=1 Tax=Araneus ventricosus TaxID=182803 RepID=A0A4Y2G401_ARAVE|nr:hypothetical protein AVEN_175604-1 [Araneus ventricosus]